MFKVKDFNKFQHFKDRRPPWIKLYRDLLDDVEWHSLEPKAAKALVMIWLIASEDKDKEGTLPELKTLAFRLRLSVAETSRILGDLSHWLEGNDNNLSSRRYQVDGKLSQSFPATETNRSATETGRYQVDTPEAERETEQETEAKQQSRGRTEAEAMPALPAATNPDLAKSEPSRFSRTEIEAFIIQTKPHVHNPGGLATRLLRTGEEDSAIALWKRPREPATTEISWPKWVYEGDVEANKQLHLQMVENQRRIEAEFQQEAASDAA